MDGKGQWMDNVFIERLWRSLKYECVYLNAFQDFRESAFHIRAWMDYYNDRRPHSALGDLTPRRGLRRDHAGAFGSIMNRGIHLGMAAALSNDWGPLLTSHRVLAALCKERDHSSSRFPESSKKSTSPCLNRWIQSSSQSSTVKGINLLFSLNISLVNIRYSVSSLVSFCHSSTLSGKN